MTIVDRINKVTEVITKEQYGPDSPIVQLLMIVSAQDDEIYELKKEVGTLRVTVATIQDNLMHLEERVAAQEKQIN
jgi:uncharacterized coiled-coil protein SlyX